MDEIVIQRTDGKDAGRYVVVLDGHESEMTFRFSGAATARIMHVDHTGVPAELSGRGVGLALVRRAAADARAEGFRIEPLCSFVRVMMQRHKDLHDVLVQPSTAA